MFWSKFKSFVNVGEQVKFYNKMMTSDLLYKLRKERFSEKTLFSTEQGITSNPICDKEVIVSLTTYGNRINEVYLSIESIMQGTVKPNRIILWISEEFCGKKLPITLQKQAERGLEIEYCKDIRSYTKLIPALRTYPESVIITIDDDAIYDFDVVEKLVNSYQVNPHHIHANRIHKITMNDDGTPKSYNNWVWCCNEYGISHLNFLTGVGGVLYPPHCFDSAVFDEEVFLNICKTADDIWFYLMALKKGTFIQKVYTHSQNGEDYILNENPSEIGLLVENINNENCQNDVQLRAVLSHYKMKLSDYK